MIPKPRTREEEEQMARLMAIADEREFTLQEAKEYFQLLGYDEDWADHLAHHGFPTE